ncbi:ribokinase [Paenibacillus sp. FSL H8-0548]|uniref:ribokinase n=1 Tax=Paenibacillus sp. FSL H8-0548 TaxID=1920422 RepID=UPI00096F995A|nr:ribokinase [Paenibacillus sp. FSL H8-0548]OMF21783.1 ribokinase [Paenibacillus sp. FSL H8-0548]
MVKICVIGSCAMDLVVTSTKRPHAGETVLGDNFSTVPGGKGANQAIAAARLGAHVTMIGCIGEDFYGKAIIDNLISNNVTITFVDSTSDVSSGTAHIILAEGDNSIIVVKGANDKVSPALVEKALDTIKTVDMVLVQQEIPEETVCYVSDICHRFKIPLLLNPAPARTISKTVIENAAYLTPNEHECAVLFPEYTTTEALRKYPNKLFITEGSKGVRYYDGEQEVLVPTYKVNAIDTTGAGDTFNAALAVALAEGSSTQQSLKFANRAASLSVTKFGAQGGMPTRSEVEVNL